MRLEAKGLLVALIKNGSLHEIQYRFLSAQEIEFLNILPLIYKGNGIGRLKFAGVGQLANPIQLIGMLAYIRQKLQKECFPHDSPLFNIATSGYVMQRSSLLEEI